MFSVDKVLEFSFTAAECAHFRRTANTLKEILEVLNQYNINTIYTDGNDYDATDQIDVVIDMLKGFAEYGAKAFLPDEEETKTKALEEI